MNDETPDSERLEAALDLLGKIADCANDPYPDPATQCRTIAQWATDFLFPNGPPHQRKESLLPGGPPSHTLPSGHHADWSGASRVMTPEERAQAESDTRALDAEISTHLGIKRD